MDTEVDILDNMLNALHLNSTIGELPLFDAVADVEDSVTAIKQKLKSNKALPGVIISESGKTLCIIPKRAFFETLSRPYSLELFSKRAIRFLVEILEPNHSLVLPASMLITDAVKLALERPKSLFDDPIIVDFDKGRAKILDTYTLILAQSTLNQITMRALKDANDLKTEMLSIAAHDLKNPLGTIIGLSKISAGLAQDEDVCEMCSQINDTAQHMLNLIVELLNSSVIESGRMQLRKQIFDLEEIVSAIVYQNKTAAEAKNQLFEYSFAENFEFTVEGDALKLREAIENLVSNAIKYSPQGGKISVRIDSPGENVVFKVTDSGPGLSEEDMAQLFGKFQRLSAQPTGGESSTGLGLYIAKQIIDLHCGRIYAESTLGEGSTFFIELPFFDTH